MQKKKNNTPDRVNFRLHLAAIYGDLERVKFWLNNGASFKSCMYEYRTLHSTVRNRAYKVAIFLVENGEINVDDINAADAFGNTALFYAAMRRDEEMIKILIANGADESTVPDKRKEQSWKEYFEEQRKELDDILTKLLGEDV